MIERRPDSGFTLIEVVVAIAILGIAVAALLGGMFNSILTTDIHRKQATAETVVRDYAEAALSYANAHYTACPAGNTYATGFAPGTGYSVKPVVVEYYVAGVWTSVCPGGPDTIQRLTVEADSNDNRSNETAQVVVRRP